MGGINMLSFSEILSTQKYTVDVFSEELIRAVFSKYRNSLLKFQALYAEKTMMEPKETDCEYNFSTDELILTPKKSPFPFSIGSNLKMKKVYKEISFDTYTGRIVMPDAYGKLIIEDNYAFNIVSILFILKKSYYSKIVTKPYTDIDDYPYTFSDEDWGVVSKGFIIENVHIKALDFGGKVECETDENEIDFEIKGGDKAQISVSDKETFTNVPSLYLSYTCWTRGTRSSLYLGVFKVGYDEINRKIYFGMSSDYDSNGEEMIFRFEADFRRALNNFAKLYYLCGLKYKTTKKNSDNKSGRTLSPKSNTLSDLSAMEEFNDLVDLGGVKDELSSTKESNGLAGLGSVKSESSAMEELNSLIGLESIKSEVCNLINFTKMQLQRKKQGLRPVPVPLHLVFSGNPGTGKTTVARILAKLYKEIGVLTTGKLVEVDRSGLVAGYVGQTAIKTQEKINEAMGGVLFIDEAYTLVKGGPSDYGQEAIDTLVKAMEDHREDFVVIVAGYTNEMVEFIESNPGLRSRFNKYIEFPDYSIDELNKIFMSMCKEYDYVLTDAAKTVLNEKLSYMVNNKGSNFANARDVRNYFRDVINHHASRVANINIKDKTVMTTITEADM